MSNITTKIASNYTLRHAQVTLESNLEGLRDLLPEVVVDGGKDNLNTYFQALEELEATEEKLRDTIQMIEDIEI